MRDDERVRTAIGRAIEPVGAPVPDLEHVVGRARRLRRRRLVASAVVAILLAVGVAVPLALLAPIGGAPKQLPASEPPSSTATPSSATGTGIVFEPASGWYTRATGPVHPGSISPAAAWASTISFSPNDTTDTCPRDTMRQLPQDGIVICATLPLPDQVPAPPGNPNFPDRSLPLQLSDADARTAWEGQVAPDVPEYLLLARVNQEYVDVRVYFGTLHPDGTTLAAAQEELKRLQLPVVVPSATAPAPLTSGTPQVDQDDGISILVPNGWSFLEDPSGPTEPKTVFAVSNVAIPKGGDCAPTAAQDALPPDGVLAWVIEYHDPQGNDFPPRPDRFSLDPSTLAPYECSDVPSYMFRFSDQGRDFQVHVVLGSQAAAADRDQLLASLSSMQVDRCPPAVASSRALDQSGVVEPVQGPPGTSVTVSGDTARDEGYFWVPSDRIEVWWNDPVLLNIGPTQDATHFPVATINPGTDCTSSVTFQVPNVPPGQYLIGVRVYQPGEYGWLLERRFTVTP